MSASDLYYEKIPPPQYCTAISAQYRLRLSKRGWTLPQFSSLFRSIDLSMTDIAPLSEEASDLGQDWQPLPCSPAGPPAIHSHCPPIALVGFISLVWSYCLKRDKTDTSLAVRATSAWHRHSPVVDPRGRRGFLCAPNKTVLT
ncbi:hypothetical protein RRG08_019848 [Elysia crispata]|uniref:Uncharacterized protein n=1 Tax=Elysia crispata TaxID=231223 RepID=A0AAE1DMW7_9GAST|nr:hypothetical protein RRG08_019848 [Elysia crispata]